MAARYDIRLNMLEYNGLERIGKFVGFGNKKAPINGAFFGKF
jgi:hypothetical protein